MSFGISVPEPTSVLWLPLPMGKPGLIFGYGERPAVVVQIGRVEDLIAINCLFLIVIFMTVFFAWSQGC